MSKKLDRPFLGRGWSFPPGFSNKTNQVFMVQEEEDIQESLSILLSTRQGERSMQPRYGCNLEVMLFEPLTTTLITRVSDQIKTSILFNEPRIDLNNVRINTQSINEGLVLIEITYTVRNTNSRFNFVYPFYLEEGSNIRNN